MSAPTDVLLVMDLTVQRMGDISALRARGDEQNSGYTQVVEIWKRDIWQARSAVAELIEAASKYRASQLSVEAGATARKYRRRNSAGMRLDDALASVGGAS